MMFIRMVGRYVTRNTAPSFLVSLRVTPTARSPEGSAVITDQKSSSYFPDFFVVFIFITFYDLMRLENLSQ